MQTKARGRQIESLQGITNLAGGSESGVALPPESVESSRVLEVRGKVGRRGERGETVELDTIRIGSKLLGCAGSELEALDPHEIEDRFWASPLWFVMDEQLPNPFSLGCSHTEVTARSRSQAPATSANWSRSTIMENGLLWKLFLKLRFERYFLIFRISDRKKRRSFISGLSC